MYKLAKRNPETIPPYDFQKSDSSYCISEEPHLRHKEFFTLDEVADYFGDDKSTVSYWHDNGQLKEGVLGLNGDLYFAIDNIFEFKPTKERKNNKTKHKDMDDLPKKNSTPQSFCLRI